MNEVALAHWGVGGAVALKTNKCTIFGVPVMVGVRHFDKQLATVIHGCSTLAHPVILECWFPKIFNPYPTAFPYGNGMVLHFNQQQESSTTETVHKVINKGLKTYV